jgi:hypothetical protein
MGGRVEFVCQASTCRRQVEIEIPTGSGTGQVSHPRRACGSAMKKANSKPAFGYSPKRKLCSASAIIGLRKARANLLTDGKTNFRFGGSHRAANNT